MCGNILTGSLSVLGCVGAILLAMSFSSLHATETGLDYNWITKEIRKEPYTSGLHFIGFGHRFIRFPNTFQNMQYSTSHHDLLHTRTSDGLPLTLGVSFQYTLILDKVYDLYMNFKLKYEEVLFNVAAHIIANTASNYSAYNFFNDKQTIAYSMQKMLNDYLPGKLFVTVEALQILLVELPRQFEDAILESIAVKQNITRTEKTKANMMVAFQTQIMASQQQANQTIALAEGQAKKILAEQGARAMVVMQNLETQSASYQKIKKALRFGDEDLMEYVWWDTLAEHQESSNFVVGMNPNAFVAT
uniref:Band 7 domain-containing protein n=1 Tax=Lotharella globosa TaxID=91324 RepID=A0A7S4DNH4_9EUKA|mmetsp:Transcript_15717/g.29675  ORF Transcript_15717/g.29675 Transcript_15717/m.29675 type:complete len:303 (-) Transcript_15717:206-1114(-)